MMLLYAHFCGHSKLRGIVIIKILKPLKSLFNKDTSENNNKIATSFRRLDHGISPNDICSQTLNILSRLQTAGFQAYLVGGGVRDLICKLNPKDFDVATDATPEQVRKLFRNSRIIGRRFKIVHIFFKGNIVEVSTFRGQHLAHEDHRAESGMLLRDNVFGSLEEDAWRRDFSVNGLYYDSSDGSVIDFVNGYDAIKTKTITCLGDPDIRYREDPVRMLRAVRFAGKLGFSIDEQTAKPIHELKYLLKDVPAARLFIEVVKLFQTAYCQESFQLAKEYKLVEYLFPQIIESLEDEKTHKMMELFLKNTAERLNAGKSVTVAFLYVVFLWKPLTILTEQYVADGKHPLPAMEAAAKVVLSKQQRVTAVPRRLVRGICDIWALQYHLDWRTQRGMGRVLHNPRFRAGYDFLLLRSQVDESLKELADWWTNYQDANKAQQDEMIKERLAKVKQLRKAKAKDQAQ